MKQSVLSIRDVLNLMFLILFGLKLTNLIDWSWWWVTAPLWGQGAITAVLFLVYLVFFLARNLRGQK